MNRDDNTFFRKRPSGYIPINDHSQILDNNTQDENNELVVNIFGYKKSKVRLTVFHGISIIFLGIPYLLYNWFPSLSYYKYKKSSLQDCDILLVTTNQGQSTFVKVTEIFENSPEIHELTLESDRIFVYQHVRYIWSEVIEKFINLGNPDDFKTIDDILRDSNGIEDMQRIYLLQLYGFNIITVQVKSYWNLFRNEILNPFYLFQFFSITLWSLDDYYYYASCVFFLSAISIISSLYETRSQSLTLKALVDSSKPGVVHININNQIVEKSPDDLVPGDILVLPQNGYIMPCDAVLLTGTCVVNESMLTGESMPIMKTPPHHSGYEKLSYDIHKRHILFAGTNIVQTRFVGGEKVLAKVTRTGFNTNKGYLIKSILFPQPIGFQFYRESIKFVTGLFCIAILGMLYCVRVYIKREEKIKTILIRTLDVITIVVPAALPMAMTAGTVYSQSRLKKLGIFCISPPRINICGKIKLVCFDKTGTLTDDNLTLHGVLEYKKTQFEGLEITPTKLNPYTEIVQAMATCHSLTILNETLSGDPLDLEMFKSIDWDLIEPGEEHTRFDSLAPTIVRPKSGHNEDISQINNLINFEPDVSPYLIGIIKCYQFSSEKQCMSVVTRVLGHKNMKVFTKGAPEKILALCDPVSVPLEYYEVLQQYTKHGYRVIAFAYRELSTKLKWREVNKMKREEIEKRLIFLGFMILENCLKPETKPIIEDLHAASIRTVMITGDNLMTAISVARDCRMVLPDEDILVIKSDLQSNNEEKLSIGFDRNNRHETSNATILTVQPWKYRSAMDGNTWSILNHQFPEVVPQILARGTIFARFGPEQKSQLVCLFQQLDYVVAMCGDGANDCSALRAAHIGISLSQAEASVAAPFTSKIQNINCVKLLALEGRCALVTSFGIFKYMTMYSLIQFCTILILYTKCSLLGTAQFLYIDLVITASLAFTMGNQSPSNILGVKRPMSSLISLANLIPLLLQIAICAVIQITSILFLMNQDWYIPKTVLSGDYQCSTSIGASENVTSWDNTTIFLISCFQYLILAASFCKGRPYREPVYKNYTFMFFLVNITIFTVVLVVYPLSFMSYIFEIEPYNKNNVNENQFRLILLLFPAVNFVTALFIENFIAERVWLKTCIHFLTRKKEPKNKFKLIENELENKNWLEIIQRRN